MKCLRILLVEENRILRESITSLIKTQPDMRVAVACDGIPTSHKKDFGFDSTANIVVYP